MPTLTYLTLGSNPFIEAYSQSGLMGKGIFLALLAVSICSWTIMVHKYFLTRKLRDESLAFRDYFRKHRAAPLGIEVTTSANPFKEIYAVLKKHTLEILSKNRHYWESIRSEKASTSFLSAVDIDFVEAHLASTITNQTKTLEKHLYILAMIVSLAPFLGLLGTVWGILDAFTAMQLHSGGNTNQMMLSGLSLALTTTVLGLLDAIPALIGYNYFKHFVRDFQTEMEGFSTDMLASVELQYRQVDVR